MMCMDYCVTHRGNILAKSRLCVLAFIDQKVREYCRNFVAKLLLTEMRFKRGNKQDGMKCVCVCVWGG